MKRHRFDPFSLVAGLLFGFLALFFLTGDHTTNDLAWPWAAVIPLVAIGLLVVLYGLRRALAHVPATATNPEPEPELEPATDQPAD